MPRLVKRSRGNYTNTDNTLVRDDSLHWGPRGLFNYMWSQADGWQFYVKELVKHSPGGETELRNYLNELEEHGYLKRTPRHDDKGKFGGMNWILSDTGGLNRRAENPDDGETSQNHEKVSGTPSCGETVGRSNRRTVNRTLSNINIKNYQNKEITNKRKEKSSAEAEPAISEIINYLNKKAGTHYNPTTKAYQELIKTRLAEGYTVEDFKTVINNQAFSWQNTQAWKYMRPSTLFKDKYFDEYLHANDLSKHTGKHVEKGTDWAKKEIDTSSGIPTDTLKDMFMNLDKNLGNK
ncbi:conserved phage C-terminal domain-containing protein [Lactobacillus kitasatonis]|uniref:conserved phage C-terminal domain-containing protein n=1 Tax=Lactobacillus kitasatonis TaxID=237446 RepID=UPI0026F264DF|nr:conserved phage C-terminal domain-containing protein [Lactobacillus kitasatonis]